MIDSPPVDVGYTALLAALASQQDVNASLRQTIATQLGMLATFQRSIDDQRQEVVRLIAMVEGLTAQLDELLNSDEARAELKKKLAEAEATAKAAAAAVAAAEAAAANLLPTGNGASPSSGDGKGADGASGGSDPEKGGSQPDPKRDKHGRGKKPETLDRSGVRLRPDACGACNCTDLGFVRSLTTTEYDFVRAYLRIRETTRDTVRCRRCKALTTPPQPPMPMDRASCTFAFLAWLLHMKGGLFVPLERVGRELERLGARIPPATVDRWWATGANLLVPIAGAVRLALLQETHIRTDGTGLLLIYPRRRAQPVKGDARAGEVDADGWLVHEPPTNGQVLIFGNDAYAVYHFTASKHGEHAMDFLRLEDGPTDEARYWAGTITADAVSSQNCLFEDSERTESGCNAHGLRKFRDDADKAPLLASRALAFIRRLYEVEAKARSEKLTGAALLALRRREALPVAQNFRAWIDTNLDRLLPKNPVRKAMQYYINHWDALTRYLSDAHVPIDNNWSERALRKVALIRNNSLFAGGEEGARRLCAVLTLVQTCRLIDVDPCAYLEWAMTHAVPHPSNRSLKAADLTPHAYKAKK